MEITQNGCLSAGNWAGGNVMQRDIAAHLVEEGFQHGPYRDVCDYNGQRMTDFEGPLE
jgi:hypothetical protein